MHDMSTPPPVPRNIYMPSLLQNILEADERLFLVAGPNQAKHVNRGVLEQGSQNMGT